VQRMVKDAEAHADEAHRLRELADAKNVAESLAYQTEKTLAEHRDKLEEADASTIEGRIMELRQVLDGSDLNAIREKTQVLNEAVQPLAQAIYADAQAEAQADAQSAPPPGGNGGASSEDEVVEDADYEVIEEDEAARKA